MYQALYRKWRPRVFADVLSQPHVTKTLQNEIKTGRIGHAYLFTGSRGTGKTTCARIFAMAVNCEHPHEDGSPCLECTACTGIEQGSLLDVSEIDAASNNGVEDIRKLREEAGFTPAVCKYRVYIIDEVHMLSGSAFNALLKIMEEPPAHVIFILATTEVHKVPATILSRCQRFDFHRVTAEDISSRVQYIASQEDFTVTEEAAELIAKLADGGMRDALSLLDQCVAYQNEIDVATVSLAAGLADRSYLTRFADVIAAKDASAALEMVDELYRQSRDLTRLCEELITYYRNLMVVKTVQKPEPLVLCMPSELEELRRRAATVSLPTLLYCLSELQGCLDRISVAAGKRTEFEMCMIRLCSPELNSSNAAVLARLDQLETRIRSGFPAAPVPADTTNRAKAVPPEAEPEANAVAAEPRTLEPPASQSGSEPVSRQAESPVGGAEPQGMNTMTSAIVADAQGTLPDLPEPAASTQEARIIPEQGDMPVPIDCWPEILERLAKTDPPLCGLLAGSTAQIIGPAVCITSNSGMLSSMLRRDGAAGRLSEAITAQLGKKYRLRVRSVEAQAPQTSKQDELAKLLHAAEESGVQVHIK